MLSEEIAEKLLLPLWRSIDDDFKKKYRGDAWGIFENFVKTAACNESLKLFFEKITRLVPMGWRMEYSEKMLYVLQCGQDNEILNALRTECSYLILLTRAMNNERKDNLAKNADANNGGAIAL